MLISRLEKRFGYNKPIFTEDIFDCMKDYSRQRIYQFIAEAIKKETLVRYDTGVYYLPTETEFGRSVLTVNEVVNRKYISDNGEIFGIYGKYVIELNFLLSYQVPNTIEVITNKESRDVREIEIRGRKVILRKSRLPITKENESAYTLMELFNGIDIRQYREDSMVRESISDYIKEKKINSEAIYSLASSFPARTMKNLATSGVLYEIAQQ
ncbi:MAG: hypothetical protein IJY23_06290 [Clostridia bacterium]|nr:hypothetical protein [Clostridia bacterium]